MIRPRCAASALAPSLLATVLGLGLASGCERNQTGDSVDPSLAAADNGPVAVEAAAAELADAIDPGPISPMSANLPAWLAQRVRGDGSVAPEDQATMVAETVDAFSSDQAFGLLSQPDALLALAQAIALLEAPVAAGTATPEQLVNLERLYAVLDQPTFAHDQGMFSRWMPALLGAAREAGGDEDIDAIEAFGSTLFDRMRRAAPLRRVLVAQLLRTAPLHPAMPKVLAGLANNLGREDPTLALRAVQLARDLDANPSPIRDLDVAYRCCLVLDLACADAAVERVSADPSALDDDARKRLDGIAETRAVAGIAAEKASATDHEGRIAYAQALFELGLYPQAKPVYAAIYAEHPDDARAVAGLARVAVAANVDITSAAELIGAAGPLQHKDRDYYEVAIGARVLDLFNTVLPRIMSDPDTAMASLASPLAAIRSDIEGYEALGSDLAVVLHAILDLTERGLPLMVSNDRAAQAKLLRASLDDAVALQRRLPTDPHAYILLMSAAELMPDKTKAVAAASTPVPAEGSGALQLRRARALLDLAIVWEDPSLLQAVANQIDSIPDGELQQEAALTAANMYAVAAQLRGQTERPVEAIDLYYGLFQQFQDANAVNNLGVLLWRLGDLDQAKAAFESAMMLGGDQAMVAQLNRLAIEDTPETRAGLEAMAMDTSANASVSRLAMAWLAARSSGKDKARWTRMRKESLAEPTLLPVEDLPNRAGVVLLGQLSFDVSYSAKGLSLTADAERAVWLVQPPPG